MCTDHHLAMNVTVTDNLSYESIVHKYTQRYGSGNGTVKGSQATPLPVKVCAQHSCLRVTAVLIDTPFV